MSQANPTPVGSCDNGMNCPHVMQTRCSDCGREQYALRVWSISHGAEPCVWCGAVAVLMTCKADESATTELPTESEKTA